MIATTSPAVSPSPAAPAAGAAPRLLDQVRAAARPRHYSSLAEQAFVSWIRRFVLFHDNRNCYSLDTISAPCRNYLDMRTSARP